MALMISQQYRQQLCQLLTDAIAMLCKNMLNYNTNLCIEGLIGVTTDNTNVILVNINETITQTVAQTEERTAATNKLWPMNLSTAADLTKSHTLRHHSVHRPSTDVEFYQMPSDTKLTVPQATVGVKEDSRSSKDSEGCIRAVKQESDAVLYNCQDDDSSMDQHTAAEHCASPGWSGNNLDSNSSVSEIWPEFSGISTRKLLPSSSEAYFKQRSHAKGNLESISNKLNNCCHHSDEVRLQHSSQCLSPATCKEEINAGIISDNKIKKCKRFAYTVKQDMSGNEIFICECGETFRHRSSLCRHQKMHLGMVYRCNVCGITMNRKDNLLTHKRCHCLTKKQRNPTKSI